MSAQNEEELSAVTRRLMNDYFYALDSRQFARAADTFGDEVRSSYGGLELPRGRKAVLDYLEAALRPTLATRHHVTSVGVVANGDRPRVRTHAIAYVLTPDADAQEASRGLLHVRGLTYDDELSWSERGWEVAVREHQVVWTSATPASIPASGKDVIVGAAVAGLER